MEREISDASKQLEGLDWGATQAFIDRANREAAEMMDQGNGPFEIAPGPPGAVAYLALLDRKITFKRRFFRSKSKGMKFIDQAGKPLDVEFWGVRGNRSAGFGSSVRVLDWKPGQRRKALELLADEGDRVVMLESGKAIGFEEACQEIRRKKKEWVERPEDWNGATDKRFHEQDTLQIPVLEFGSDVDFAEKLQSVRTYGNGIPRRVSLARQRASFRLDERGAAVRVVVEGLDPFGAVPEPPKPVPRDFVFDRPFFVFLWREGAEWPYFAAWIGDAEGMEEFGK